MVFDILEPYVQSYQQRHRNRRLHQIVRFLMRSPRFGLFVSLLTPHRPTHGPTRTAFGCKPTYRRECGPVNRVGSRVSLTHRNLEQVQFHESVYLLLVPEWGFLGGDTSCFFKRRSTRRDSGPG